MDALYGYCRQLDDVVDESSDPRHAAAILDQWQKNIEGLNGDRAFSDATPFDDLAWAVSTFDIKIKDLLWIMQGVRMDLKKKTYASEAELLEYCDGVASAVGLCLLPILGISRDKGYEYALATGRALQLTNMMRDIQADLSLGRIYFPQSDLSKVGLKPADLVQATPPTLDFLSLQRARIAAFYHASDALARQLDTALLKPAELMKRIYGALFAQMQVQRYPWTKSDIRLNCWQKGRLWWQTLR